MWNEKRPEPSVDQVTVTHFKRRRDGTPNTAPLFVFTALTFCSRRLQGLLLGSHFRVKPCVSSGKGTAGTGGRDDKTVAPPGDRRKTEESEIRKPARRATAESGWASDGGDAQDHVLPTAAAGPQGASVRIRGKCRSPGGGASAAVWFAPCVFQNLEKLEKVFEWVSLPELKASPPSWP